MIQTPTSLSDLINHCLKSETMELTLRRIAGTGNVSVTVVHHLGKGESENELARQNKHCRIVNVYRDGRKAGMQLVTNTQVPHCQLESLGENTEYSVTGHSVESVNLDDTT